MLSALWPINHLHTLARGGSPSASSHAYLQGLVDALSTSNAMPPVPTLLTGSWLGLTLVIAIAIAPVLMIAAVWQRHPFLPISRVRWLGMVPAVATLIGGFGMYWFSATITLDAHTLRAVSKDANMAHDLFGGNAPISAWIINRGGSPSALKVLDDGHLILLHQPVYWVWLVTLALSAAVGVCWAIATPFGASLATVFPPMTGARPKTSAVPMGLCTGCIVVGLLVAGSLSDGESAIADRKKHLQAMEEALCEQAVREDQDRAEQERIRQDREEAERTQITLSRRREAEALQARDLAVIEERQRSMKEEDEAKMERARADKQAAVAELERAAAAKQEKVAEVAKQADSDHMQLISAWTTAKDSIILIHPTTLAAFDQAIVDVDRLEDTAKKAGAVAERADILARLTGERAALVKAQENRVITIKTIFKETEYRKLSEASQAFHDYLAAGGDRSRIANLATRLETPYPWATKTGDDAHGTWADLDAGKISIRMRKVTVGEENAKTTRVLWFAEHEFSALDYLAIMPNTLAVDIPSTNMPACGIGCLPTIRMAA